MEENQLTRLVEHLSDSISCDDCTYREPCDTIQKYCIYDELKMYASLLDKKYRDKFYY